MEIEKSKENLLAEIQQFSAEVDKEYSYIHKMFNDWMLRDKEEGQKYIVAEQSVGAISNILHKIIEKYQ